MSCKGSFTKFGDEQGDEYRTNLIIVPYNTAYGHYIKKNARGQIESRDLEERNFRWKGLIWRYKYKHDDKERLIQEIKYDSTGSGETTTAFEYRGQNVIIKVSDPRGELRTYQEMTFNEERKKT